MWRLYIMPLTGDGLSIRTASRPKYHADMPINRAQEFWGLEQWCICACDTDSAQHALLVSAPDVLGVPLNLDATLSIGAVSQAQAFLEAANIPAHWVNTSRTFREVLRVVFGMFQLARKVAKNRHRFLQGVTLDDQVQAIPAARRQAIADSAIECGIDSDGIGLTDTIREALRKYGQRFASQPFTLGQLIV